MKKILIALALIILIIASLSLLSMPRVKADASDVQILSYNWYIAPANTASQAQYAGDLIVIGEVQNVGTSTLTNVAIGADSYNSTGGFLASGSPLPPYIPNLSPGQKAPFCLDLAPIVTDATTIVDPNWASSATNVTVRVLYAIDTSQTQYAGLEVPTGSATASNSTGTYTLTGTVQNTGDQTTGRVWVITTFYNGTGTVVSLNYTNFISQSLSPGKSAAFTATPLDNTAQLSNSIASYSILIQSDTAPATTSTPTAPITTGQPTTSPSSTNEPTDTASPPLGVSLSLVTDVAIAAVAIVVIILVVFMLFRRRQRNAEMELPPPPPPT